ncbi:hypothetical protein FIA58_001395 [Flavobacterium jejuense]|uniref:Lipoprotein n=1 Tax=Flavobacterium jejuense TaxID=1544455 RepID=A0ABX0IR50_9FLAO|nr:hypothetical protein [Flavobacterium jejuense]NHN24315.1 hypothetical protein [Flavobacterium jejuense]
MKKSIITFSLLIGYLFTACSNDDSTNQGITSKDINTAEKVSVDRFSSSAGNLFVRTSTNGLPGPNVAINFDEEPFITTGLKRTGSSAQYYNFDVQSSTPAPIYVFFKEGSDTPLSGQNNIIASLPGEIGYNDFWIVNKVIVPSTYVPNSITSLEEILASNYTISQTNAIVNCPVVPFGSTASKSKTQGVASELTLGWYKGKAVAYFSFEEATLTANGSGAVPISPIYVMFNDNNIGPASGFKTETGTMQTHNVLGTIPSDSGYSPLWAVLVIDNTNFDVISDLDSASNVMNMYAGVNVNCPVVN